MSVQLRNRLKQLIRRQILPNRMQVWSIGIYAGDSYLHFKDKYTDNPIMTRDDILDVNAAFIADPFMLKFNHTWFLFFEVMNRETGKGQIGLSSSEDGKKWTYLQIVLTEPFHLSYPYVFEFNNDYYMIPECYETGAIRLYKASRFPTHWSFFRTLLSGRYFADASVFRYDNRWWLYADTSANMKHNTLSLYYADELTGPWLEHPKSPIIQGNAHAARPAGRVMVLDDRIIRFAQDCCPAYGTQVLAFEITELSVRDYHERGATVNPILTASKSGWNASGSHHIDPHALGDGQWIACVDGFYWGPYIAYPPLRAQISGTSLDGIPSVQSGDRLTPP